MKIIDIKKKYQGKFITYYEAIYKLNNGEIKNYELVSRDHNLNIDSIGNGDITGVGLVCYSVNHDKILLQKEFRLAVNKWIYTFPAGLVDLGEDVATSAKRELKEETGVNLVKVIDVLPPCFTCQGFSDEIMSIIVVEGEGETIKSTDPSEEIEAKWFTKEEVKELFKKNVFMSVRTQMFLWCWLNEKES